MGRGNWGIAALLIALAVLCPVSFVHGQAGKQEAKELRKLRELRDDPALAEANQDLLLKPFHQSATGNDLAREALALEILGTLYHPKQRTLETLFSFLNKNPESATANLNKKHYEVLWALGRWERPRNSSSRRSSSADHPGRRGRAVQRISGITPARTVLFAPDEARADQRLDRHHVEDRQGNGPPGAEPAGLGRDLEEHAGLRIPGSRFLAARGPRVLHGTDTCSSGSAAAPMKNSVIRDLHSTSSIRRLQILSRYPFIMLLVRPPESHSWSKDLNR